jgi:hypothetical protein
MTLQMHVLTLKETGHVLAAVARANSGPDPDVAALVGTDLPVIVPRKNGDPGPAVAVPVPAELLEVKTLVYDPAVLAHPQAHVVDGGRVTQVPAPAMPPTASLLFTGKVTVKGAVTDVPVVVVIVGKDDPNVRRAESGNIPALPPSPVQVDLTHRILPGKEPPASIPTGKTYYMLIAEGGSRLRLELANT